MKTFAEIYGKEFDCCEGNYTPILDSIGTIVLQVDDQDYHGDSRVLYKRGEDEFGLLIFGWGSCSGCDALQGCNSAEEVEKLAAGLEEAVKWLPRAEMLKYFIEHDWKGDFSFHAAETHRFIFEAKKLLAGPGEVFRDGIFISVPKPARYCYHERAACSAWSRPEPRTLSWRYFDRLNGKFYNIDGEIPATAGVPDDMAVDAEVARIRSGPAPWVYVVTSEVEPRYIAVVAFDEEQKFSWGQDVI